MNRYKITFTSLSGLTDDRAEEFFSDAQAIAYAQANARGRRAQVYADDGRLVYDSRKVQGMDDEP